VCPERLPTAVLGFREDPSRRFSGRQTRPPRRKGECQSSPSPSSPPAAATAYDSYESYCPNHRRLVSPRARWKRSRLATTGTIAPQSAVNRGTPETGKTPQTNDSKVPGAGIEPTRLFGRPRILSPLRLPVSPPRREKRRVDSNDCPTRDPSLPSNPQRLTATSTPRHARARRRGRRTSG
jgi:hypothetical protein